MLSKQLIAKRIGASGCYFLSIVYLCEKRTGKQIDQKIRYFRRN